MLRSVSSLRRLPSAVGAGNRHCLAAASHGCAVWATTTSPSSDEDRHVRNGTGASPSRLPNAGCAAFSSADVAFGTTQRRFKSTSAAPTADEPSFEETMDKLFTETQQQAQEKGDEWFLEEAAVSWEPSWYNLADHAVSGVQAMHNLTGWQYATSIVAVTCTLRMLVFPLAVRGQRAASRMAHLQPELAQLKARYESLGTPTQAEQRAFSDQMKAVFNKYQVKPFAALTTPLVQTPLFLGMFFGMKKMPDLFPADMSTGGMAWFTDLTAPDPTYILPAVCGLTFLATIETGKEQMIVANQQYGPTMVNAFRAMAVIMVPVITTFPAAMLCYWVPNNLFTMCQSILLRNPWVKKQFGIWERPKPVPGTAQDVGFQETMSNLVKKARGEPTTEAQKIKMHNEEVEAQKQVKMMSKSARARRRAAAPSLRRK